MTSFEEAKARLEEKAPGVSRFKYPLIELPFGDTIHINFVVINGAQPGPTFLLTGNIHGDEVTGLIVCHRVLEHLENSIDQLQGRVICIPSLNPTGLWVGTRQPIFDSGRDPNRQWPDSMPEEVFKQLKEDAAAKSDRYYPIQQKIDNNTPPQAKAFKTIFQLFKEAVRPDFHLDLHTFSTLSLPFTFLDNVLYVGDSDEAKQAAQTLFENSVKFAESLGLTLLRERAAGTYISEKLHRSTSGAVLHNLKIPSLTLELGPMDVCPPDYCTAGVTAVLNGLKYSGNLPGDREAITSVPVLHFDCPHRYFPYPMAPATGILDFVVRVGSRVHAGDVIGVIRHIDGRKITDVVSEVDGYIVAIYQHVSVLEGAKIAMFAVEDDQTSNLLNWKELPFNWFVTY